MSPKRLLHPGAFAALAASVAWIALLPQGVSAAPATTLSASGFDSAERCGECHKDIHSGWKASIHAKALEDPIFQQALQTAAPHLGPNGRRLCLACHAPTTLATGDDALQQKISWEGVTCDFCHSVTGVTLGDPMKAYTIDPGAVERGPIENAVSTGHDVAYSPLFTQALLCAGCHEYTPPGGKPVLTTYSEWKASPYAAEGVTCQSCHMSLTRANVVDPKIQRLDTSVVNVHEMPGGHSLDQLLTAVRVGLDTQRDGDSLRVNVKIRNVGAGHTMPTGFPSHHVVMDVQVSAGTDQFRAERVYARTLYDENGEPILRDDQVMVRPAASATDTRLAPREERMERFAFPVPSGTHASVTVRLRYVHVPLGQESPTTNQVFYSERRFVKAD